MISGITLILLLFFTSSLLPAQTIYTLVSGQQSYDGIVRSTDIGRSWQCLSPRKLVLSAKQITISAMDVVDSSRGRILYISAENTLYKSTDFGKNWEEITAPTMADIHDIKVNQNDPRWVYVATASGLWQSNDSGKMWKHAEGRLKNESIEELAILPNGGLAAITRDGEGLNLWLADNPAPEPIWTLANCYLARNTEYYFSPLNTGWNRIAALLLYSDALTPCDIRFWLPVQSEVPAEMSNTELYDITYQGSNTVYAAGSHGVWQYHSAPAAEWTNITGTLPDSSIHALAIAGSDKTLFAGTWGHGIYRRAGDTWVESGLKGSEVRKIVVKDY